LIKNFTVKKRNNRKTRKQNQRRATLDGQSVGTIGTNDSNFFRDIQSMRKKRDKFKFSVALTTEILELITLTLTLLLFLCSTAVTLCVNADDKLIDARINAPDDNGVLEPKINSFTETKNNITLPKVCKVFPKKWFNDRSRFNNDCIEPIWQVEGGMPREQKSPHPLLLNCLNPLEVAAFIAILVSMGLQLVLLGIFILVRKCQQQESQQFINKGRIRKKISYRTDNAKSTQNGILEHKDDGMYGTYKSTKNEVYLPNLSTVALQQSDDGDDDLYMATVAMQEFDDLASLGSNESRASL